MISTSQNQQIRTAFDLYSLIEDALEAKIEPVSKKFNFRLVASPDEFKIASSVISVYLSFASESNDEYKRVIGSKSANPYSDQILGNDSSYSFELILRVTDLQTHKRAYPILTALRGALHGANINGFRGQNSEIELDGFDYVQVRSLNQDNYQDNTWSYSLDISIKRVSTERFLLGKAMPFFRETDLLLFPREPVGGRTDIAFFSPHVSVNLTNSPQTATARQRNSNGIISTAATEITGQEDTMQVSLEVLDWYTLQLAYNQTAEISSEQVIQDQGFATVPTVAPYTITDARITAANEATIVAQISNRGTWGEEGALQRVGTTPAAAREFQVDGASNTLTFNATEAGAPIRYSIPTPYTTIETLGVSANPTQIGSMSCWFRELSDRSYPTGLWVHVPFLTRARDVQNINNESTPVQMSLEFGIVAQDANNIPYQMFNLNTGVLT